MRSNHSMISTASAARVRCRSAVMSKSAVPRDLPQMLATLLVSTRSRSSISSNSFSHASTSCLRMFSTSAKENSLLRNSSRACVSILFTVSSTVSKEVLKLAGVNEWMSELEVAARKRNESMSNASSAKVEYNAEDMKEGAAALPVAAGEILDGMCFAADSGTDNGEGEVFGGELAAAALCW